MYPSQYSLRHRSPADVTITEQRILGLCDLHLQCWQNVHADDDDDVVVVVQRRFLGRASRTRGAGADIARARESASSLSCSPLLSSSSLTRYSASSGNGLGRLFLWYLKKRRRFLES